MQNDLFSFTTAQFCHVVGASKEAVRAQVQRTGCFRGVTPAKLPNNRFIWPRAETMALVGQHKASAKVSIDLRATLPFLSNAGLIENDPVAEAIAIALNDPRDDASRDVAEHLDACFAVKDWNAAQVKRLSAARQRMAPEQWTDSQRLMARAVAAVVASVPDDVMAQAVADYLGGLLTWPNRSSASKPWWPRCSACWPPCAAAPSAPSKPARN